MLSAGFEIAISAGERLPTHILDRSATGIGIAILVKLIDEETRMRDVNHAKTWDEM
jgi:hypothetical protein